MHRVGAVKNITKFYVANLPDGCTPWELRCCLEGFREISGTYVEKKRDKGGCRFGFVSFVDVKDRRELEKLLKGVKMGDYKLKANISRFAMENSGSVDQPEVKSNRPNVAGVGDRSRLFNVRDFRSYSDVMGKAKVAGGYSKETRGNQVPEKRECEKVLVVPDRTVAFKELLGLAVVGKTVNLETLVDFDRLLRIIGTVYLKI
ncbi:putative RNA recognition motif domain, nucleotide-binding alpha-beta plait domain superfamily [Helianthus annuus]|nr:putative RNA recognition motif domain, nucleotide-binding alpha-beta plait domain superfamily [Helianthus annuus]